MRRPARPAVVLCLAMVLAVALVAGLSLLASALVATTWTFAALVATRAERAPEPILTLPPAPHLTFRGLRAPPLAHHH